LKKSPEILSRPQTIQAAFGSDSEQPFDKTAFGIEALQVLKRLQQGLLGGIAGLIAIAQHVPAQGQQFFFMAQGQLAKGCPIAPLGISDQFGFSHACPCSCIVYSTDRQNIYWFYNNLGVFVPSYFYSNRFPGRVTF
jgi:hypothetical protein